MATDVLVKTDFKKNGKKPGLWDRGVATGGPGQKPVRKKNDPVCQTVTWPLVG